MTDSPRDVHDPTASDQTADKRPWHAPSVQEIDHAETQALQTPNPSYDGSYANS